MRHRNLTVRLDAELYKKVKVLAAKRDTSISALVTDKLAELVDEESHYSQARTSAMAFLESGFNLGTGGQIDWTRDELHER